MIRKYSDKELVETLKQIEIIIDTREQQNSHLQEYLQQKNIPAVRRKLDVGDYACQIGTNTFEKSFVIERKGSLDELCGNLTVDRERFEREFLRAKANETKVYLFIENASWTDVFTQNYRSKLSSKSLLASLLSWQTRFNVTIVFCKSENTARLLHGILYYAAREEILGNK